MIRVCLLRRSPSRPSCFLLFLLLSIVIIFHCKAEAFPTFGGHSHDELYRDLGLPTSASKEDIRKAFRQLTRQFHPDLKDGIKEKEKAKFAMAKVLRAYEILSDEEKKDLYDQTGVIPGEPFNPQSSSVDEIFDHFHQKAPIFSKSPTLESGELLERIIAFHGPRLFLFQVYDDHCKNCRTLSSAWESFYDTSIVKAGIVEMFRIDAKSSEGSALLTKLKITYKGSPIVFLYVDGSKWSFHALQTALQSGSSYQLYQRFRDFVMGFFRDQESAIRELKADQTSELLNFLHEPRPAARPMRVLLPRYTSSESLPLALRMRYETLDVARTSQDLLLRLVERCELKFDVRNHFGERVMVPAFMILSQQASPIDENLADSLAGLASCDGLHVGATVALTYAKAAEFVRSLAAPRHRGMDGLPYLDAAGFYEVCKENCVVWVRRGCAPTTETAPDVQRMVELLKRDYYSFKTGYLCADELPFLRKRFPEVETSPGPFIFALSNSDDAVPYWFSSLSSIAPEELKASDIDRALSDLMSPDYEKPKDAIPKTGPRISSLFPLKPFPISRKSWYFHMFANLDEKIASFMKIYAPILFMYIVHTRVLNPMRDRQEAEKRANTNNQDSTRSQPNRISIFTPDDLENAKEGKGFLILLLDAQADSGGTALPPSHLASDPRFTLRLVSSAHDKWQSWMKEAANNNSNNSENNEEDSGLIVLAIRRSKMKAAVKPHGQSLDTFLGDLLDGNISVNEDLPSWAFQ